MFHHRFMLRMGTMHSMSAHPGGLSAWPRGHEGRWVRNASHAGQVPSRRSCVVSAPCRRTHDAHLQQTLRCDCMLIAACCVLYGRGRSSPHASHMPSRHLPRFMRRARRRCSSHTPTAYDASPHATVTSYGGGSACHTCGSGVTDRATPLYGLWVWPCGRVA